jgi:single-stranded DNA-binding protein
VVIARFPLAEHHEENRTTWHQVVAFGPRAEKLKGMLTKGQVIEVIGYLHERQVRGRDGKTKTVQEVYAAVIKPQ